MPVSPLAQFEETGSHGPATLGQLVDDAQRRTFKHGPVDQAGLGQLVEPVGQHPLADPWNRSRQDREPRRTLEQQPEDDARPTLAQQGEGLG